MHTETIDMHHDHDTPGHEKTTEIVINGTEIHVREDELTFEQLVHLADLGATGEVEYSVKYTRGPHDQQSGVLHPGQSVKVKKGMRFVVRPTVRS